MDFSRIQARIGNKTVAYVIGGAALVLGLFTAFAALTLEDTASCRPDYVTTSPPNAQGEALAGQVVERDEMLMNGCKLLVARIDGHKMDSFAPGQQAFDKAQHNPAQEAVLRFDQLPARFQGLQDGTRLTVLYIEDQPLAISLPTGPTSGTNLNISDARTDYGKLRLGLWAVAIVVLILGGGIILFATRLTGRNT